jgi:hypothetical protein
MGNTFLIDYILRNKKTSPSVQGTRICRSCEVGSGHFFSVCKTTLLMRWRQIKNTKQRVAKKKKKAFQVHLLKDESTRRVYETKIIQQILV